MDIDGRTYNENEYKNYIHGSAEVIGLMCLRVFCENDNALYQELAPAACSLGSALQKINFLRDIKADYDERGRVYFPGVDFNNFTEKVKREIEDDIKSDFKAGFKGIRHLPGGARLGVYIAYTYYIRLFKKICNTPANVILQKRIRISDAHKLILYFKAVLQHKLLY